MSNGNGGGGGAGIGPLLFAIGIVWLCIYFGTGGTMKPMVDNHTGFARSTRENPNAGLADLQRWIDGFTGGSPSRYGGGYDDYRGYGRDYR